MQHQQEIIVQRLVNAQNAMKKANEQLIGIQHALRADWDSERLINEIEEVLDFLRWASQQ